jgi:hypothetical protein
MRRGAIILLLVTACGAMALLASPLAVADKVLMQDGVRDPSFNGGEFDCTVTSPADGSLLVVDPTAPNHMNRLYRYTAVVPKHLSATSFATFCVETTQYIGLPGAYDAELWKSTDHTSNWSLTPQVAWLFSAWNSGRLVGGYVAGADYAYAVAAPGRPADATELQTALWGLKAGTWGSLLATRKAYKWAYAAAHSGAMTTGDVYVLRLMNGPYANGQGDNQDQLVEFKENPSSIVPEPGSFALLATGALGLLPLLRRRRTT